MNKKSKVLALKYRPSTFDDLIGQEVVAETIINSIKSDKIPNAYLFTGIRGIGKTTIARIVAKSLNCLNGNNNLCKDNFCNNCDAISNSSHIDVLEMDAASKTGVDDVRDLIEFSRYGPTSSKFKIFFLLLDLPQILPEHENLHNVDRVLLMIFVLFFLQYAHQDHIKKRMSRKYFFLGNFVI